MIGTLSYTIKWDGTDNYGTTLSLFYDGHSGSPYSYVYGDGAADADNLNQERGSTSRTRSLIYIPVDENDIMLIDDGSTTAAEQWTALDKFITEDEYLNDNRGSYAEKNSNRTPFTSFFDFKIIQDIGVDLGDDNHRLQLSLDIFNLANLISSSLGVRYSNPFDYRLLNFEGYAADGTTPTFTFSEDDLGDDRYNILDRSSRWRMRLGVRYIFN